MDGSRFANSPTGSTAPVNEASPSGTDDGYSFDDEEPEDDSERCPECGAFPEEYHDWDCSRGDCDEEDAADCASPNHPGCRKCEVKP